MWCRRSTLAVSFAAALLLGGCGAPPAPEVPEEQTTAQKSSYVFEREPAWASRPDALMVKAALTLGEPVAVTQEEVSQLEVEQLRRYRALVQGELRRLNAMTPEQAAAAVQDGALRGALLDDLLTLRLALTEGSTDLGANLEVRAGVPSTAARLLEDQLVNSLKNSMILEEPLGHAAALLQQPDAVLNPDQSGVLLKEVVDLAAAVFRLQGDRLRGTAVLSHYLSEEVRLQIFGNPSFSTWLGLTPELGNL